METGGSHKNKLQYFRGPRAHTRQLAGHHHHHHHQLLMNPTVPALENYFILCKTNSILDAFCHSARVFVWTSERAPHNGWRGQLWLAWQIDSGNAVAWWWSTTISPVFECRCWVLINGRADAAIDPLDSTRTQAIDRSCSWHVSKLSNNNWNTPNQFPIFNLNWIIPLVALLGARDTRKHKWNSEFNYQISPPEHEYNNQPTRWCLFSLLNFNSANARWWCWCYC